MNIPGTELKCSLESPQSTPHCVLIYSFNSGLLSVQRQPISDTASVTDNRVVLIIV